MALFPPARELLACQEKNKKQKTKNLVLRMPKIVENIVNYFFGAKIRGMVSATLANKFQQLHDRNRAIPMLQN